MKMERRMGPQEQQITTNAEHWTGLEDRVDKVESSVSTLEEGQKRFEKCVEEIKQGKFLLFFLIE